MLKGFEINSSAPSVNPSASASFELAEVSNINGIDAGRRRARGFDLPEVIFKQALIKQGFTWQELLRRTRPTEPLFSLNPGARSLCLEDCFEVLGDVRGKKIILTDDIFTTGATMQEAARTLKAAGAGGITAVTFAGALDNLG